MAHAQQRCGWRGMAESKRRSWVSQGRTGVPAASGNDCRSRVEGLASGLADLVLFLDLSMPNGLLPETKF